MTSVQTVIERVTALAKQHSVSISQVLRESRLNKSVLDNMKRGSMPSADKLAALADYFDCSLLYLLGRSDIPALAGKADAASAAGEPALTAEEIAAIRKLLRERS